VKLLEPKLGDVVSGDLWRLVNKLCETAMSNYYAAAWCCSSARLAKLSSNLAATAGSQLFIIGDRLPKVTFRLPFGTL